MHFITNRLPDGSIQYGNLIFNNTIRLTNDPENSQTYSFGTDLFNKNRSIYILCRKSTGKKIREKITDNFYERLVSNNIEKIKNLITDGSHGHFTNNENQYSENIYDYGKFNLFKMLSKYKRIDALEELVAVAKNEHDIWLQLASIDAIIDIDKSYAIIPIINILKEKPKNECEEVKLKETIIRSAKVPSNELIKPLKDIYQSAIHNLPKDQFEEYLFECGNNILCHTLVALGRIPSLQTLEVIEHALNMKNYSSKHERFLQYKPYDFNPFISILNKFEEHEMLDQELITNTYLAHDKLHLKTKDTWFRETLHRQASIALGDWINNYLKHCNNKKQSNNSKCSFDKNLIENLLSKYNIKERTFYECFAIRDFSEMLPKIILP